MPTGRKFGRLPRAADPAVPHLSSLVQSRKRFLAPIPPTIEYAAPLGRDLGMMLNNYLGDCTAAGAYHARQVWTAVARGAPIVEPDPLILRFYRECSGYDPADPATDVGAVEQDVLRYWLTTGLPVTPSAADEADGRDRLLAYLEVDPRNWDDVCRTIYECGVCYVGFNVPTWLGQEVPPPLWNRRPGDEEPSGGHCVILTGYSLPNRTVSLISWGTTYRMTRDFLEAFCDEAYGLVSTDWVQASGRTPLGLTPDELRTLMVNVTSDR